MNSDERTVSAVVARDRARRRLRTATIGAGILGVAVAGVVAAELPGMAHGSTTSAAGSPARTSTGHSAVSGGSSVGTGSTSGSSSGSGSSSSSSSGSLGSSSAPSSSSGSAGVTSGGS